MYFVYVIWSKKLQKRYTGSTKNVEKRIKQHNDGRTPFTRRGTPWILIYFETFETKSEALKREIFLKSGAGRNWLDKMFPEYKAS
ncbi:MAG: GIY-YIG nuclease family protein [Bacteroidetes bacterium]|nr:GIY-YIG nuclease family protein [Bacteroidota bacterium]